ncbi:MAG: HD domain-containing phosphohydrolase [Candidatus Eisenbacteria bacterium]
MRTLEPVRGDGPSGRIALRAVLFVVGSGMVGAVSVYLGFGYVEAAIILALGAVLCALTIRLPWRGLFFPCDALLVALGLLTGRSEVAVAGVGAAIVTASVGPQMRRTALVASIRNAVAIVATVAMWRALVPTLNVLALSGGLHRQQLGGSDLRVWALSGSAIPALLLSSLGFLVIASVVETVFRERREYAFGEFWFLNFGKSLHHMLFTAVLGAVISISYRDIGMTAFVLFAFPTVLTRDALKRNLDLRASRVEALKALSSSVDARDKYTYDHSNRVARLAAMLAREMGFAESTVEVIEGGALLHDIGKLSVDIEILSKPGPLGPEETACVRQHPLSSAEVVSHVELLKKSVDIVRYHHERPDGRGYPDGLKGHEIPVGARILNVADAFDAMVSDRPYRRGKTLDEAVEELRVGSGSEFDPVVVEYLCRLLGRRKHEILSLDAG